MGSVILILSLAALVALVVRRRVRALRSATVEVEADDRGVRRVLADGRREEVDWFEVMQVDVFTTTFGPHRASGGAVVLFGTAERGCVVPLDRLADSCLLDHAHRLPGFDPGAVVAAVGAPEHEPAPRALLNPRSVPRTTVCWRREGT
jgi:hypothetical protein